MKPYDVIEHLGHCPECGATKQEQGEPVAWIRGSGLEMLKPKNGGAATVYANEAMSNHSTPLYTTPQQRKPLTDEQFISMVDSDGIQIDPELAFVIKEMVERAHDIKEQP